MARFEIVSSCAYPQEQVSLRDRIGGDSAQLAEGLEQLLRSGTVYVEAAQLIGFNNTVDGLSEGAVPDPEVLDMSVTPGHLALRYAGVLIDQELSGIRSNNRTLGAIQPIVGSFAFFKHASRRGNSKITDYFPTIGIDCDYPASIRFLGHAVASAPPRLRVV